MKLFNVSIIGLVILTGCSTVQVDYSTLSPDEMTKVAKQTEVWGPEPARIALNNNIPSDATVLFDGSNVDKWVRQRGGNVGWTLENEVLTIVPKSGNIQTRDNYCDMQMHIEWMAPKAKPDAKLNWGNSGIYIQGRYELQIFNSYDQALYANGQGASIYKQHAPLVNVSKAPLEWQHYDIVFTAPRFKGNGDLLSPAYITAFQNGVLVQNHAELSGVTRYVGTPYYQAHGCAPIVLQEHGDEVSFRNIWVRKL